MAIAALAACLEARLNADLSAVPSGKVSCHAFEVFIPALLSCKLVPRLELSHLHAAQPPTCCLHHMSCSNLAALSAVVSTPLNLCRFPKGGL